MKKLILFVFVLSQICRAQERLIIVNEGNWQSNNARISYFEDGNVVSNKWFEEKNGYGIGDTPNDILQVGEDLIAIAVNSSNIIQFIHTDGTAVSATEDVPNNRKLATDGKYIYITSYAHECGTQDGKWTCNKGFVAKVNLSTFKVEKCCEVGWEPEGIAYYKGYLFIANSGGYAYQEGHNYESTVSIVNAESMKLEKNIDTGAINLYGKMSQSERFLCINSSGDYYETPAKTVIFDCERALHADDCFLLLEGPATYNCATPDGNFLVVGSTFDYTTFENVYTTRTINPKLLFATNGINGDDNRLPGTIANDITEKIAAPYGIYVNPYTGFIYVTDANNDYSSPGYLHQWTPNGEYIGSFKIYINPAHFLALGKWELTRTDAINFKTKENTNVYDLNGIKQPYYQKHNHQHFPFIIRNGKTYLFR